MEVAPIAPDTPDAARHVPQGGATLRDAEPKVPQSEPAMPATLDDHEPRLSMNESDISAWFRAVGGTWGTDQELVKAFHAQHAEWYGRLDRQGPLYALPAQVLTALCKCEARSSGRYSRKPLLSGE